jgi:hypothetical protein
MTSSIARALAVAALLGAFGSAAHAFTFQGAQGVTGGSAVIDPDSRFSSSTQDSRNGNGQTVIQNGNTTLHFGARGSGNQNFDPNNLFDPFYRDGR